MYNVYTDDLNHHLQATGVRYTILVGGTWVNSLVYADDMVLSCTHGNCSSDTLGGTVCRAYAGPHAIVFNTTKTVCVLVRPKQSKGRYSTRVRKGNELRFVDEFR